MTWLAPEALRHALDGRDYPALSSGAGVAIFLLLTILLLEVQFAQTVESKRLRTRPILYVLVIPLLLASTGVVGQRVFEVLFHR